MIPDLQKIVRAYLDDGRGRTVQSVAARSGVSASTIRRIAQGEIKETSLANAIAILKVTASPSESFAFLKAHFPETGKYFERVSKVAGITEQVGEGLERALYDGEQFTIISLASTPGGTTTKQVTSVLGSAAEAKLEDLLDLGILTLEGDRFHTAQPEFAPTDNTNLLAQIGHCSRFIRNEHQGQQKQHCAVRTNGVSREGQVKIHAILQKALEDAGEAIAQHPGSVPIFLTALMGTFVTEATNA